MQIASSQRSLDKEGLWCPHLHMWDHYSRAISGSGPYILTFWLVSQSLWQRFAAVMHMEVGRKSLPLSTACNAAAATAIASDSGSDSLVL